MSAVKPLTCLLERAAECLPATAFWRDVKRHTAIRCSRVLLAMLVIASLRCIFAQTPQSRTGSIRGQVADPSEAVVPNAAVSVTPTSGRTERETIPPQGPKRSQIHSHANRNLMCVTTVWTFHLNPHRSGHFRIVSQSLGYDELFLYLIHHRAAFRAEFKWHCLPPLPGLVWVRKTPFQKL